MAGRPFWEEGGEYVGPAPAAAPAPAPAAAPAAAPFWENGNISISATPGYRGSLYPVSADAQGNPHFDWNAGILGDIIRTIKGPVDAATGEMPIMIDDKPNPDAINRAIGFASYFSPASVASRVSPMLVPNASKVTVPTATELKAAGAAGYDAARGAGLDIKGGAVADMSNQLIQKLQGQHGVIPETAPKTYAILDKLANPPGSDAVVTISGLDAARQGLSRLSREDGTDAFAAGHGVRSIDDFLSSLDNSHVAPSSSPTASPQAVAQTIRDARGNYAAAQRSNAITGELDRAATGITERAANQAAAANSGWNFDNALRQRINSMLQRPDKVAGYSQPELDALNQAMVGGPARTAARHIGNFLGGGGGLGQAVLAGMGAAAGGATAGVGGGIAGAALPLIAGPVAKSIENSLARRAIDAADNVVRQNSPMYRQMLAGAPPVTPQAAANPALWQILRGAAPAGIQPTEDKLQELLAKLAGR